MIIVTQGHESGIGLEVFFKSVLCIDRNDILIIAFKDSIIKTLNHLKIKYQFHNNKLILDTYKTINFYEPDFINNQTISCILYSLQIITKNDLLLTLPSSKDQFLYKKQTFNGHTEFFRNYFNKDVSMFFQYKNTNLLLITDHVPINSIEKIVTEKLIIDHTKNAINYLSSKITKVYISGINPHAGENNQIGNNDSLVAKSIFQLQNIYPHITFIGPLSADSLIHKREKNILLVYIYHDQGLGPFKAIHKFHGLNISLGLPFTRVSVDFGTGFDLFGKNKADYLGCLDILKNM